VRDQESKALRGLIWTAAMTTAVMLALSQLAGPERADSGDAVQTLIDIVIAAGVVFLWPAFQNLGAQSSDGSRTAKRDIDSLFVGRVMGYVLGLMASLWMSQWMT
jgi:uncharacterized membrane protein YccC